MQTYVELSRRQILSRVNRHAIAPDLKMQSRFAFRTLTHRRNFLARSYRFAFFDQQRLVVPVGTEVSIVMFEDNKLSVTDESTTRIHNSSRCGGSNSLS